MSVLGATMNHTVSSDRGWPMAERHAGASVGLRLYLDVPYAEKESAKALGARWDPATRRWFDPRPPTPGLDRWAARPPLPDVLLGEDRTFGDGLFVDLIPRSCWFTNVRTCVTQQDWERLRRPIFRRVGYTCEACGATEDRDLRRWLEAHERWHFDERTGVQSLRRLIALCSSCHLVTHFGYANVQGRTDEALAHLRKVNGLTLAEALAHVHAAEDVWIARSARVWELDLSILTDVGITLRRPERAADRPAAAAGALARVADRPCAAAPSPARAALATAVGGSAAAEPAGSCAARVWSRLTGRDPSTRRGIKRGAKLPFLGATPAPCTWAGAASSQVGRRFAASRQPCKR